jgi:hypothetical protein
MQLGAGDRIAVSRLHQMHGITSHGKGCCGGCRCIARHDSDVQNPNPAAGAANMQEQLHGDSIEELKMSDPNLFRLGGAKLGSSRFNQTC